jgi:hypothetical protein
MSQAYIDLQSEINDIVDSLDEMFLENRAEAFEECIELDEVPDYFKENYRSNGVGFQPFDHLSSEEILQAALTQLSKEEFGELILKHSTPIEANYYVQWNEMFSFIIGEEEYQIDFTPDSRLASLIEDCTPEEREELFGKNFNGRSFYAYGNPCERLIWRLDAKSFLSEIEPVLRAAGLTDPDDEE